MKNHNSRDTTILKNEKGQAFLIIGMMMVTFFSLFMFVVHTGQLINAKINLQNAADLAAYTGASVQARQLNTISFLNYEMRRQYKKFLFRYYVIGNLAQKSTQNLPNNKNPRIWSPTGNSADDYQVPVVCIVFNPEDNYCQLRKLPTIPIPKANPLDAISVALNTQITQLEAIRKTNCERIDGTNQITLALWLFNTDPELETLNTSLNDPKNRLFFQSIKGLGSGMGLVPRLIVLRQRIRTLEKYVNLPRNGGNANITRAVLNRFEQLDPNAKPEFERPALAFLTAFRTLGEYAFETDSITLEELLPGGSASDGGGNQSGLLSLNEVKTGFESYFLGFQDNVSQSQTGTDCDPIPKAISIRDLTVGFTKDPNVLTHYAVRLTANANLMFSPFQGTPLRLKAYAAAQPFGSRIGPVFDPGDELPYVANQKVVNQISQSGQQGNSCFDQVGGTCLGIPALPVFASENLTTGTAGWLSNTFQRALFSKLVEIGGGVQGNSGQLRPLGPQDFEKASAFAMAPNPVEKGHYNIINELGHSADDPTHIETGDPFTSYFGSDLVTNVWAPLLSSQDAGGNLSDQITRVIDESAKLNADLKATLKSGLVKYLGGIKDNTVKGEAGETFNLAPLQDPLNVQLANNATKTAIKLTGSEPLILDEPLGIKSSWSAIRHAPLRERGRTGYSVKFVSFDFLQNKVRLDSAIDEEARFDLQTIKH